jgi:hypothetical protein
LATVATMRISSDRDTIVSEIEIAVPPARVFEAITDPQQVLSWWGQAGVYRCNEFKAEVRRGASGAVPESVRTAAHSKSLANIWRWILRACSRTLGWRAGPELHKQPSAGNWSPVRRALGFACAIAGSQLILELATAIAAGRACSDGFKHCWSKARLCRTEKRHKRFSGTPDNSLKE